ncbi:APC family permease [Metamycoplasma neophronis]|uniref:Amino acid permease n=1 Tax=Metamycoplasma neophronis TaxID=872983 RepID=A0ABY2Z105_9BACT|nr:APC family permease [Metamycoplasma neophronis]TPR54730.1 amino acid permease [Metamycoplasma neophronis]
MTETKKIEKEKTQKKISFTSAILMVMGSSIGAGIFFKSDQVLEYSHASLILAIFAWVLGFVAVVVMGLSLVEISSVKNDNLSFVGWCKAFNSKTIYKAARNFNSYLCFPLIFFVIPLYVVLSLQDGISGIINKPATFGTGVDWIIWVVISLTITLYFILTSGINTKFGAKQNLFILSIKFIPLVFIVIMGFVLVGMNASGVKSVSLTIKENTDTTLANGFELFQMPKFGAFIGVFLAIAAIFFAYDGFFTTCGIQSDMKEPKKTPLAILLGLVFTTIIYLFIAILFSINGGTILSMQKYSENIMNPRTSQIIFGVLNILIAIGVMGIINGFAMWAPKYYEELMFNGELPLWKKAIKKYRNNYSIIGVAYTLLFSVPFILIFSVVGALGYIETPNTLTDIYKKTSEMNKLYNFSNVMANWMALLTFTFIALPILGGIINRKTQKVLVPKKYSYFLPSAWICCIITFLALTALIVSPFVNLIALAFVEKAKMTSSMIVSRVVTVVILLAFIAVSFLPIPFENKNIIKKYGNEENYQKFVKEYIQKQNIMIKKI